MNLFLFTGTVKHIMATFRLDGILEGQYRLDSTEHFSATCFNFSFFFSITANSFEAFLIFITSGLHTIPCQHHIVFYGHEIWVSKVNDTACPSY